MRLNQTRGVVAASVVERFADLPAGESRIVGGEELGAVEIAGRRVSVGVLISGFVEAVNAIVRDEDPELSLEWRREGFVVRRERRPA